MLIYDILPALLKGWGDNRSAAIVDRITEEEQAHVATGGWIGWGGMNDQSRSNLLGCSLTKEI